MPDSPAARQLARRLRELREQEWRDAGLTQAALAKALSAEQRVGAATISSWESATTPKLPPEQRVRTYARFFATQRSLTPEPHLLALKELSAKEEQRRLELERELLDLHEAVRRPVEEEAVRRSWQFPDSGPVTIICPDAPHKVRGPLASQANLNFTDMLNYADLDALVELFGHLRSENPSMGVFHRRASRVVADDLSGHLVLLGGVGWNHMTRRLLGSVTQIPIRQIDEPDPKAPEGDPFAITEGKTERRVYPELREVTPEESQPADNGDPQSFLPFELIEDVAWFARLPNPFNSNRTLTICNGIYSRGVLGAVRCLTDIRVRDANENYLAQRFPRGDTFALLMRVPVIHGQTISPDLQSPHARLFEWPSGGASQ